MLLLVMLNVGIRKIIAGEGRVQEADLVFVEDPLELVGTLWRILILFLVFS